MATAQQSATEILSILVSGGARAGDSFPVNVAGPLFSMNGFPGSLQAAFFGAGYQLSDLTAGLAYATTDMQWLSLGQTYGNVQMYVLEQAGFVEAGGVAPAMSVSAQRILNVCAGLNSTPGAVQFNSAALVSAFVGTVGSNTFAPADLLPAIAYAVSNGWLRLLGYNFSGIVFSLTATGAAQAM